MKLQSQLPVKALNQAYRKEPIDAQHFEQFKDCLGKLLKEIDEGEQEENTKNLVSDFLKDAFYKDEHHINTKGDIDLAVYHKNTQTSDIGVLIETKKPSNKGEMMSLEKPNQKAMQQLVYYYLKERVEGNNLSLKHLIATDTYQWFIFDENQFEKWVYGNKALVKKFKEVQREKKPTSYFYKEVAQPLLEEILPNLTCTYFNLQDYQKLLGKEELKDKEKKRLIHLYKLLSPTQLLKKPFANDSNSLNRDFYSELLHILGLEEVKEKNKKVIQRKSEKDRNAGSFLENTISKLERKRLYRVEGYEGYTNEQERYEAIALELCITWVNRILFLKLLEAQLLQYHKGNKQYKFLNAERIHDFDGLDDLFFGVLAKKADERKSRLQEEFANIPYLNSSLFEETILEAQTITAGNLTDEITLPLHSRTILKDDKAKRRTGEEQPLNYLFQFLDAYNFASEGTEEVRKDNKSLINASVLGLIFEKINGYKDGSFYTPSFITMYMCRETLRRATVQKFSEHYKKEFKNFEHLQDFLADKFSREDRLEANKVLNSLKVCDPAVGSGHFLVSALNELIAIKADLRILADKDGARLPVGIRIENDELFVLEGGEEDFFEYRVGDKESQSIQQTLFHEKQQLIEGCLFGVDINPNSVKICRLRLWIELLKNAYYTPDSDYKELETLPNIDINIKAGNSLISRFALDADLGKALKKSKWNISSYRLAVQTYRNASSKEEKRDMERLMEDIKANFRTEIHKNDPKKKKLQLAQGKLYTLLNQTSMFEQSKAEAKKQKAEQKKLEQEIDKLETEIEEIESNKIYEDAFEWRFEFPEVLDDKGNFVGFDVVVGNPPYIRQEEVSWIKSYLENKYDVYNSMSDLLTYFIELSHNILRQKGILQFIISNKFTKAKYGKLLRMYLLDKTILTHFIDFGSTSVFDEASVDAAILGFIKASSNNSSMLSYIVLTPDSFDKNDSKALIDKIPNKYPQTSLSIDPWRFESKEISNLKSKIEKQSLPLKEWDIEINYGIKTGYNDAFIIDSAQKDELIENDKKSAEILKPLLRGRDIKRYYCQPQDLWLITTLPSLDINIEKYTAIQDYLKTFGKKRLSQSGNKGARKKTNNKWFETQDSVAYWGEFEKPKIMYIELMRAPKSSDKVKKDFPKFMFDESNSFYALNTAYIITGKSLKYLIAILNSSLTRFMFPYYISALDTGGFRVLKDSLSNFPVKKASDKDEELVFSKLVNQILELKKENPEADTSELEGEIDRLVYELYGLSEEEIGIVEGRE